MGYANTAAKVRKDKEAHPERYCRDPRCLWRVDTARGPNPCQKHPHLGTPIAKADLPRKESVGDRMRELLGEALDADELKALNHAKFAVQELKSALESTNDAFRIVEDLQHGKINRIDPNMSHAKAAHDAKVWLEDAGAAIEEWIAAEESEVEGWKKQAKRRD